MMKILLVDDDVFLRDMYATKFKEAGDDVSSAENARDALTKLDDQVFDVVIMDMVMPGTTGVELIKMIKSHDTAKDSKCIVLSNQGEAENVEAAKAAGATGYIIKAELIPSEVVQKVHALVG